MTASYHSSGPRDRCDVDNNEVNNDRVWEIAMKCHKRTIRAKNIATKTKSGKFNSKQKKIKAKIAQLVCSVYF